jgi:hypothetical protein
LSFLVETDYIFSLRATHPLMFDAIMFSVRAELARVWRTVAVCALTTLVIAAFD